MCENLRGSYRCVCNLGYEAVADGRECTGERARLLDGWRGFHPHCTPLTLLSGPIPALQMWTSAPSTASCVTMGGAATARAAIAAPAPRASASGQTRRPVKVQGPGGTQTRTHTQVLMHTACYGYTHAARRMYTCIHPHRHAQRHTSIHTQSHSYTLRYTLTRNHIHTYSH